MRINDRFFVVSSGEVSSIFGKSLKLNLFFWVEIQYLQKDSMKKAFQVRRPLGNAERLFVKQWVFTLLSFAKKGNGFFLRRSRRRVVWGGPWSSDTRRHARGLFPRPSRPSARHFP